MRSLTGGTSCLAFQIRCDLVSPPASGELLDRAVDGCYPRATGSEPDEEEAALKRELLD
jgi:hypothetical protein